MFGFSIQKLLVLVAVIAAVWYGFKLIGRLRDQRKADDRLRASSAHRFWPGRGKSDPPASDAEEMVECPVCQAYVPVRGATGCGRSDCPY